VVSGKILRMDPDGSGQEIFINTGGRVLGFDFDASSYPHGGLLALIVSLIPHVPIPTED
jgi:glutamine synthetase type III